jgi:hypothetical protein
MLGMKQMVYHIQLLRKFFHIDDYLFQVREAEQIKGLTKSTLVLVMLSMIIYGWSSWIGLGTGLLSNEATSLPAEQYELHKLWFVIGRLVYACLFVLFILYVTPLLFQFIFKTGYKKIVSIQMRIVLILLVERITWIPLFVYLGLEWYVSPLSFGIIGSYLTNFPLLIYFFGAISLFQCWIIWFQVKSIAFLSDTKKGWIWLVVLFIHFIFWSITAFLTSQDFYLIGKMT